LSGIQDALKAAEPKIATGEMDAAVREFSIQSKTELAEMNKKGGEKFLAENGKKEGIVTLKSGLQYKVLAKGKEGGASPKADDQVTTHYHGTLIDGSVFDSSVDRGEPATFGVGMVIAGWTEALQLMKAGDKWQLFLPADLAYGVRGAGGSIGPNAALIFEVELIKIVE
jgi:FKBP-type peptidyl-prolyl cis-trans isomerase FklB